ncbi:hypothetical protein EYF80_008549 [Liparis tanakae]|uniref:Uncharacterized protein n=1 Tax=Liparis tanakae TaxID=230148 RepID=A0A4Z2ITI8_9TELE|nr:hypothetical protein EYF80_008549 [Liparis tanakae]
MTKQERRLRLGLSEDPQVPQVPLLRLGHTAMEEYSNMQKTQTDYQINKQEDKRETRGLQSRCYGFIYNPVERSNGEYDDTKKRSLRNKAGSVWSLGLVLHTVPMHHPSPFIMLHMGDIGLN